MFIYAIYHNCSSRGRPPTRINPGTNPAIPGYRHKTPYTHPAHSRNTPAHQLAIQPPLQPPNYPHHIHTYIHTSTRKLVPQPPNRPHAIHPPSKRNARSRDGLSQGCMTMILFLLLVLVLHYVLCYFIIIIGNIFSIGIVVDFGMSA